MQTSSSLHMDRRAINTQGSATISARCALRKMLKTGFLFCRKPLGLLRSPRCSRSCLISAFAEIRFSLLPKDPPVRFATSLLAQRPDFSFC
ncbi:MAG: hypothetical protein ACK5OA_12840 [Acidovorax sp.]